MNPLLFSTLLAMLRHLLTAFGASLASAGLLTSSEVEAFVGAAITLVSLAVSAFLTYRRKKTEN